MMENQIPDEDFERSFDLCSANDYVTSDSLANCLPESLVLEDDDSRRRFIFKSWEIVDQDSEEKLDFIEWKSYLFALGFAKYESFWTIFLTGFQFRSYKIWIRGASIGPVFVKSC